MNAPAELRKLLGSSRVDAGSKTLKRFGRDFAGHDLGVGLAVVRPSKIQDIVRLIGWARRKRVAITTVGSRTSFWASTRAAGRVLLDMTAMKKILSFDKTERVLRAQAGVTVEALDKALARRGMRLPMAPDGYGDATLGSMVANDSVAGLGMFAGPASGQLVGLTAVLGNGEVLRTGASEILSGLSPFARNGLPDPTGILLASEGSLGIVAEMSVRVLVRGHARRLRLGIPGSQKNFRNVLRAADRLRGEPWITGWTLESWVGMRPDTVSIEVYSTISEAEADRLAGVAAEVLKQGGLPEPDVEPAGSRWGVRPRGQEKFKGISLQVPFGGIEEIYGRWVSRLRGAVSGAADPEGFLKVYFGAAGCAALIGWSHSADPAKAAASTELARRLRAELAPLGIPYRAGSVWRSALTRRIGPEYAALICNLKKQFDPDGILNPDVGAVAACETADSMRGRAKGKGRR